VFKELQEQMVLLELKVYKVSPVHKESRVLLAQMALLAHKVFRVQLVMTALSVHRVRKVFKV
jgi:hypothetical protein